MNTYPWDPTEHLDSEEAIAAYLSAAFEDGDIDLIKAALSDVAKARGMTEIAEKAGYTRAGLYKALGENGNPSFDLIAHVVRALGVKMTVAA